MANNRIRVTYVDKEPYVYSNCPKMPNLYVTQGCSRPGIAVEIITLLTNYLNLTIDVQVEPFQSNFSYLLDSIYNNKTDIYANFFIDTPARKPLFDFSESLFKLNTQIAVRKTDSTLKNITSFLNVYRWDTWIAMGCVFLTFTFFGLIVRYVEICLKLRKSTNFGEILWKMARFQLVQSEHINYELVSGRCALLVFSLFQICIILGLFQGFILTSVIKKKHIAPFSAHDDVPQMIKNGEIYIVTSSLATWFYQKIESSYASPFYEYRDAISTNGYHLVDTDEEVLEEIDKGNGAITFLQEGYPLMIRAERHCNLTYIDTQFPPSEQSLMFKKGSHFVSLFNQAIRATKYKIEMIKRKYLDHRPPSKCPRKTDGPTALTLASYYALLILLFAGAVLSCFVFGAEICKWNIFDKFENVGTNKGTSKLKQPDPVHANDYQELTALDAELTAALVKFGNLPPGTELFARFPRHS